MQLPQGLEGNLDKGKLPALGFEVSRILVGMDDHIEEHLIQASFLMVEARKPKNFLTASVWDYCLPCLDI